MFRNGFVALGLLAMYCGNFCTQTVLAQDSPTSQVLKDLKWRAVGPAIMGGRIDEIAVVESRPGTIYVATASGGLLKTTNSGTTWTPVFDAQNNISIGAVNVDPLHPEVVWVGTGEANNRQSSSWGEGVFKSLNGGRTWTKMGLEKTFAINRIQIDPKNPDTVYVAAVGNLWGANEDRGLFKTTDGGITWAKVLYIDQDTGVTDVSLNPADPNDILAAGYERRRTAFGFNGGGPKSGLFHSIDGGATWSKTASGVPAGNIGRIGLGRYRKNPTIIYAIIEAEEGGVYRSEDNGATFKKQSSLNPRPMYYSNIHVDPTDDTKLWVLGVNLHYSSDSGKNFTARPLNKIHSDFHAFWIDPDNPKHFLAGCDGGLWWTNDNGFTWDYNNNFPLGQFYEVAFDYKKPYYVYGGLQDNFSWMGPSSVPYSEGSSNDEWINIGGGDGFYCAVDPSNNDIVYQESQNGGITRLNMSTGERKGIRPRPLPGEPAYRFDWNSPIIISPHNPKRIYIGGNRLFISDERGDSWRRTDDLSSQPDRTKWPILGVSVTAKTLSTNDGQETFGQIVTMCESPVKKGLLYVGTDDGNLQVSTDDGNTWTNLSSSVPGVPAGTYVTRVVASKYAEGRVYVTFDGHRSNDFKSYIFVSEDMGNTWKPITNGIPSSTTLHVIREHPRNQNLLFAGTEHGLYVSFDRGEQWQHISAPLPNVPIDDIQIHPRDNDLILATHGRSIWILDDIGALEGIAKAIKSATPTIFPIRPAVEYRISSRKGYDGDKKYFSPIAPTGAIIQYYLPKALVDKETMILTILDKSGKNSMAEIKTAGKVIGVNRVVWDLRVGAVTPPVTTVPPPGPGQRRFQGIRGPRVLPGTYTVQLSYGRDTVTSQFTVEEDPRLKLTARDRKSQYDLLMKLNGLSASSTGIRRALDKATKDIDELIKSEAFKPLAQSLKDDAIALQKTVAELQDRYNARLPKAAVSVPAAVAEDRPPVAPAPKVTPRPASVPYAQRISQLIFGIDAITEAPSKSLQRDTETLAKEIQSLVNDVNEVSGKHLNELNKKLTAAKLKPLVPADRVAMVQFNGTVLHSSDVVQVDSDDDDGN